MSEQDLWQVRIVLRASEDQVRQATEAITRALCPDESHDGPCPTPWTMLTARVEEDADEAAALRILVDGE